MRFFTVLVLTSTLATGGGESAWARPGDGDGEKGGPPVEDPSGLASARGMTDGLASPPPHAAAAARYLLTKSGPESGGSTVPS